MPTADDRASRGQTAGAGQPVEVDLRILQANERTLLAWVRTGLALLAFGFVLARVGPWLREVEGQESGSTLVWAGAAFIALGTGCNVVAALRFVRVRRSLLEGRPIVPGAAAAVSLALGLALLGGLLAVYLLLQ